MDIADNIGKAIEYFRESKGWTTTQLAEAANLSQGSISMYENGKRKPSETALVNIAKALEVSIDVIINFKIDNIENNQPQNVRSYQGDESVEYNKHRRKDRIYRFNDLVFELNPDILLSFNAHVHDISRDEDSRKRGPRFGRSSQTILAHLTEKVLNDFLRDHSDELAFRIEDELKRMNMDAQQLIEEMRNDY